MILKYETIQIVDKQHKILAGKRSLDSRQVTINLTFLGAWMTSLKAGTGFLLLASIGLVKIGKSFYLCTQG